MTHINFCSISECRCCCGSRQYSTESYCCWSSSHWQSHICTNKFASFNCTCSPI